MHSTRQASPRYEVDNATRRKPLYPRPASFICWFRQAAIVAAAFIILVPSLCLAQRPYDRPIEAADLPSVLTVGQTYTLRVALMNAENLSTSAGGWLDISFPDFAKANISVSTSSLDWNTIDTCNQGDMIYLSDHVTQVPAQYTLISAYARSWLGYQLRWLEINIRPTETGTFRIYYRRTIASRIAPETSTSIDQQNWPVRLYSTTLQFGAPHLTYADQFRINDDNTPPSVGNGDGQLNPGETIEFNVRLLNDGLGPASNVTSRLQVNGDARSYVSVVTANASYGNLAVGAAAYASSPMTFRLADNTPNGLQVSLSLLTYINGVQSTTILFPEDLGVIRQPVARFVAAGPVTIDDDMSGQSQGNGNGIAEPGERVELALPLTNSGDLSGSSISAAITSSDPYVTVQSPTASYPDMLPGSSASPSIPWVLSIAANCPSNRSINLVLAISANGSVVSSLTMSPAFVVSPIPPLVITPYPTITATITTDVNGYAEVALLTLRNTSNTTITYTQATSAPWLTFYPSPSALAPGASRNVSIRTNNDPGAGVYNEIISITPTGYFPVTVFVALTVQPRYVVDIVNYMYYFCTVNSDSIVVQVANNYSAPLAVNTYLATEYTVAEQLANSDGKAVYYYLDPTQLPCYALHAYAVVDNITCVSEHTMWVDNPAMPVLRINGQTHLQNIQCDSSYTIQCDADPQDIPGLQLSIDGGITYTTLDVAWDQAWDGAWGEWRTPSTPAEACYIRARRYACGWKSNHTELLSGPNKSPCYATYTYGPFRLVANPATEVVAALIRPTSQVAIVGQPVQYDGTPSWSSQNMPLSYSWSADDGAAYTGGPLFEHSFEEAGIHTVRLEVSSGDKAISEATEYTDARAEEDPVDDYAMNVIIPGAKAFLKKLWSSFCYQPAGDNCPGAYLHIPTVSWGIFGRCRPPSGDFGYGWRFDGTTATLLVDYEDGSEPYCAFSATTGELVASGTTSRLIITKPASSWLTKPEGFELHYSPALVSQWTASEMQPFRPNYKGDETRAANALSATLAVAQLVDAIDSQTEYVRYSRALYRMFTANRDEHALAGVGAGIDFSMDEVAGNWGEGNEYVVNTRATMAMDGLHGLAELVESARLMFDIASLNVGRVFVDLVWGAQCAIGGIDSTPAAWVLGFLARLYPYWDAQSYSQNIYEMWARQQIRSSHLTTIAVNGVWTPENTFALVNDYCCAHIIGQGYKPRGYDLESGPRQHVNALRSGWNWANIFYAASDQPSKVQYGIDIVLYSNGQPVYIGKDISLSTIMTPQNASQPVEVSFWLPEDLPSGSVVRVVSYDRTDVSEDDVEHYYSSDNVDMYRERVPGYLAQWPLGRWNAVVVHSPVSLEITDANGQVLSYSACTMPGAYIGPADIDYNGVREDVYVMPASEGQEYDIRVLRLNGSSDDETFAINFVSSDQPVPVVIVPEQPVGSYDYSTVVHYQPPTVGVMARQIVAESTADGIMIACTTSQMIQGRMVFERTNADAQQQRVIANIDGESGVVETDGVRYVAIDHNVVAGREYEYIVYAVDQGGRQYLGSAVAVYGGPMPTRLELSNNYPNPFNPRTSFTLAVPRAQRVKVVVYDVAGRCVKTLVDATMSAGYHTVEWDGTTDGGQVLASGTYFGRASGEGSSRAVKVMLLK